MMEPSRQEYEKELALTHEREIVAGTPTPASASAPVAPMQIRQHHHHHHHLQRGIGGVASHAMHFGVGIVIGAGIALLGGVIGASISRRNTSLMSKKVIDCCFQNL